MSIINQALKKAQREQLWREAQTVPGLRYAAPAAPSRRWPVIFIALAIACGVGAGLHSWMTVPVEPDAGAVIRPEVSRPSTPVPEPVATTSIPASARPVSLPPDPRNERAPAAETVAMAKLLAVPPPTIRTGQPVLESAPLALPPRLTPPVTAATAPGPPEARSAQALYNQAVAAQEAGQVERAILLLQQTISRDPMFKTAYNSLGNLYYQQQQYQQALMMYQQALALDPQYVKARNNLGSTYLRLAMDTQAREELHKALATDDAYGLAYYNLACVYARAGDSTTAAQHLQRAIALEPQARLWARTDEDFTRVRTAAVVRQLLEP